MALTAIAVRQATPRESAYKLSDGKGLFILVKPNGSKLWRFKYRYSGKEKQISFGVYPEVSLAEARDAHSEARRELRTGIDPSAARKARKAIADSVEATIETVAKQWLAEMQPTWAQSHYSKVAGRLEQNIFPLIGDLSITQVGARDLLVPLRRIVDRGARETALRVRQSLGQVFRYAVATGQADRDVTVDLRGALPPPVRRHHPSITDPREIGALLRAVDGYAGYQVVRLALQLLPLVFVRPGELRGALWDEIDFDRAEWRIHAERMKMKTEHVVPLAVQAIDILRELQTFSHRSPFLFPSIRSLGRSISENTLNAALRRLGYTTDEMTAHGFRSMASTLLNEAGWNRDAIERQLAHSERDAIRAAYNHAEHMPARRKMMQDWADYLDQLKSKTSKSLVTRELDVSVVADGRQRILTSANLTEYSMEKSMEAGLRIDGPLPK